METLSPEHAAALQTALQEHWPRHELRAEQRSAISSFLEGSDVLVCLRTGAGKSLCFQAPAAAALPGVVVVITPLLALSEDQVSDLDDRGVEVAKLTSDVSPDARARLMANLLDDEPSLRMLYVTPEGLAKERVAEVLRSLHARRLLRGIAVDEAHVVSEWGHNFRKDYLGIGPFASSLSAPRVPIMALTATATETVRKDIIKQLRLKNPHVVTGSVDRPNLRYEVIDGEKLGGPEDEEQDLVAYVSQTDGSGIVYCRSRKEVERIANLLIDQGAIDAEGYHGGLDEAKRRKLQGDWTCGATRVIVATVAFGMGVDKANVRFVVHWDPPSSLEGLLQEAGRGGRDGQPSASRVYYTERRLPTTGGETKSSVAKYCRAKVASGACRREILLRHFGEVLARPTPPPSPPGPPPPLADTDATAAAAAASPGTLCPQASVPAAALCCDLCKRRTLQQQQPTGLSAGSAVAQRGSSTAGRQYMVAANGPPGGAGVSGGVSVASSGKYTPAWAAGKKRIVPTMMPRTHGTIPPQGEPSTPNPASGTSTTTDTGGRFFGSYPPSRPTPPTGLSISGGCGAIGGIASIPRKPMPSKPTPHSVRTVPTTARAVASRLPGAGLLRTPQSTATATATAAATATSSPSAPARKVLGMARDDPFLRSLISFTPKPGDRSGIATFPNRAVALAAQAAASDIAGHDGAAMEGCAPAPPKAPVVPPIMPSRGGLIPPWANKSSLRVTTGSPAPPAPTLAMAPRPLASSAAPGAEEAEAAAAADAAAEGSGCMDATDVGMSDADDETRADRATAETMEEAMAQVEAEMTGDRAPEPALAPSKPQRPAPKAAFLPFKKPRTMADAS